MTEKTYKSSFSFGMISNSGKTKPIKVKKMENTSYQHREQKGGHHYRSYRYLTKNSNERIIVNNFIH